MLDHTKAVKGKGLSSFYLCRNFKPILLLFQKINICGE